MSERERFLSGFSPLPADFVLPERIARDYDVESCLRCREDGGFALRLRRRSDRASFVLKVSAQGMEDLEDEFRILTRLGPLLPGAVPAAADCFQEGGMGYLLRAYLPGETLLEYREREGSCSEAQCVRIGQQLCALLDILHHQTPPVIHRDIKPENIILLPDGSLGLIDFGIARQYKEGRDTDTRHMGTRATAAPEQYGYAQTDQRTDLYALGMTLIWLATGEYDRDDLAQAPGLSSRLRGVLERSVAFAPEDRYQDASAFSAALAGRPRRWLRFGLLAAAVVIVALGGWLLRPGETVPPIDPEMGQEIGPLEEMQIVAFSSSTMEAAVRQALGKPEGVITYDELGGITRLAAVGENTFDAEQVFDYRVSCFVDNQYQGDLPLGDITDSDLALLTHMPNLQELYLCRQDIRDISALAGLPLTTLALCEDKIMDFSPLATLTELENLYLGGNPGTDYSALAGLSRLETLTVEGNGSLGVAAVESLRFLDGLTLRKLGLGLAVPKDGSWEPLTRQIALEELLLWDPGEEAVAAANTLANLKTLTIGDYYVPDLQAISGLQGLEVLNIHKGTVESLAGIESLTRLITLSVGFNGVSDLTPLAGLDRLNYLQLESLPITDFSPLAGLPALGYVVVPQEQAALVEAACPGYTFQLRLL